MSYLTLRMLKDSLYDYKKKSGLFGMNPRHVMAKDWDFLSLLFFDGINSDGEFIAKVICKEDQFQLCNENKTQISQLMNGHCYDGTVKVGLKYILNDSMNLFVADNSRVLSFHENFSYFLSQYDCNFQSMSEFIEAILTDVNIEIPKLLKAYLSYIFPTNLPLCFSWLLLLAFWGPVQVQQLYELWISPATTPKTDIVSPRVLQFSPTRFETFSNCGKENTIITLFLESSAIKADFNFEPTRIRPEIPDWASVATLLAPTDYSDMQYVCFKICTPTNSIKEIQFELQPYKKEWMPFKYIVGDLTDTWKDVKIPLSLVESRTLKIVEVISFVVKCDSFVDQDDLSGTLMIRDICFVET